MQKEKSCGVIVYHDKPNIRYLIVKSKANGHWGFTKGHNSKVKTYYVTTNEAYAYVK